MYYTIYNYNTIQSNIVQPTKRAFIQYAKLDQRVLRTRPTYYCFFLPKILKYCLVINFLYTNKRSRMINQPNVGQQNKRID